MEPQRFLSNKMNYKPIFSVCIKGIIYYVIKDVKLINKIRTYIRRTYIRRGDEKLSSIILPYCSERTGSWKEHRFLLELWRRRFQG